MAGGRAKAEWAMTSAVMVMIHNAHCSKRSQLLRRSDWFSPYAGSRRPDGIPLTPETLHMLRPLTAKTTIVRAYDVTLA